MHYELCIELRFFYYFCIMITPTQSLKEQIRLLRIEYDEEKKAFSQSSASIGLTRLVERGDAWLPIRVHRVFYNSVN